MSTLFETPLLAGDENILQKTQKDDIFLVFAICFSAFYQKYIKVKPDPYHHIWFERPQSLDSNFQNAETKNIGKKLEENGNHGVIFWGSQSGTAETFANRLARDCRNRFGLNMLAADLSDYDSESIADIPESKFAIFIVSTYGEGDPSDNAARFISWLASNEAVKLPGLRYAAFGLGNSKYKFYNRVIDTVTQALNQLGAEMLMPVGKTDDAEGATEDHFMAWKDSLFALFVEKMALEERPSVYERTMNVVEDTSLDIIDLHTGDPIDFRSGKLPRLLSTTDRNFIHLEVDIGEFPDVKYKTGDHLAIWPSNPISEVERLLKVLNLDSCRQTPLLISATQPSVQVKTPSPATWETLFEYYLEICAPVSRETFLSLAQFANCSSVQSRLKELGEVTEAYHEFRAKHHTNFGRVLEYFASGENDWSKLPQSFVLESLANLAPRYYSKSSSSIVAPKRLSITLAIPSASNDNIQVPGLATSYISAIHGKFSSDSPPQNPKFTFIDQGAQLYGQIRTSKFRLPVLAKNPIIMIGAGSGIAPFRGFMAERVRLPQIGRVVGKTILFFGCRNEDDYIYCDESESLCEENKEFMEIVPAYSRARNGGARCYVQDKVEQRQDDVIEMLIEQGAYLYIYRSSAMARDVAGRLAECLMKRMNWEREELETWSNRMRKTHRWQEDVWG